MATIFHAIPRSRYCADGIEQHHARCESSLCPCDCHAIFAQMTVAQRLTNQLEMLLEDYREMLRDSLLTIARSMED